MTLNSLSNTLYYISGWLLIAVGFLLAFLLLAPVLLRKRSQPLRQAPPAMPPELPQGFLQAYFPVYFQVPAAPAAPVRPPQEDHQTQTVYWITSSTLARAFQYLMQHAPNNEDSEPEWMLAVTGVKLPTGDRTLEDLVDVHLLHQSAGLAAFNMQDFTAVAVKMYEHGQALHAIFHSHRFTGHPNPSGTDKRLMAKLEAAGYPAIQAVFSEDGFVRFFGGERSWRVMVTGRGAQQIGADLWRITERSVIPTAQVEA